MAEDKRKFVRFNVLLDIFYQLVGADTTKRKAHLKDLSREGLRLTAEDAIPKGASVALELAVPNDNIPIGAFAEVIWSEQVEDSGYDAGMRFTRITSGDKAKLLEYAYNKWLANQHAHLPNSV